MSFRITIVLLAAAITVGVIVLVNPFEKTETKPEDSPWFYQVSMDDMEVIEVRHLDKHVKFVRLEDGSWSFEDPAGIPPMHRRWAGVTLLLSGPQTRRDLTIAAPIIDNPAQYGLDDPKTIVDVSLTADRHLQFRMGDKTTDGAASYSEVVGFPQLYIIAAAWGDVITRLATDQPIPKWFIKRNPDTEIEQLKVYDGDFAFQSNLRLHFQKYDDGRWTVIDYSQDDKERPVDMERWSEILPLLGGPPDVSVAVSRVEDQDYTQWGLEDENNFIEIRFEAFSPQGHDFVDGIMLNVGSKTPDGKWYYGRAEADEFFLPVLLLEAQWTDTLLGLIDDPPVGEESEG